MKKRAVVLQGWLYFVRGIGHYSVATILLQSSTSSQFAMKFNSLKYTAASNFVLLFAGLHLNHQVCNFSKKVYKK